ncbi:MAG: hypothetical protein ACFE75_07540, partial [Candidatus Hodarchaeota archaeon]
KRERIALYFDCICGSICSIISLSGLVFVAVTESIEPSLFFGFTLSFWIFWLILSLSMLSLGVHLYFLEKNKEKLEKKQKKRKKELKPPII